MNSLLVSDNVKNLLISVIDRYLLPITCVIALIMSGILLCLIALLITISVISLLSKIIFRLKVYIWYKREENS